MIRESIVITLNADGAPHIAPIGVIVEPAGLVIAPFRPSATLDNLTARRTAVVNYTDDVRVFAGCVTGRKRDWPTRRASRVEGAVLEAALAHEEVELVDIREDPQRPGEDQPDCTEHLGQGDEEDERGRQASRRRDLVERHRQLHDSAEHEQCREQSLNDPQCAVHDAFSSVAVSRRLADLAFNGTVRSFRPSRGR